MQTADGCWRCGMVDQEEAEPKTAIQADSERTRAPSPLDSSLERRACRICQSETGDMLRPCGCAGTMGDIHATCLSTWVNTSQKQVCEICHEAYSKSGSHLKPLKEWTKPDFGLKEAIAVFLIIALTWSVVYLVLIFRERHFIERVYDRGLPCRSDDLGRIVVLGVMGISLASSVATSVGDMRKYYQKQKEIRFVNKRCTA